MKPRHPNKKPPKVWCLDGLFGVSQSDGKFRRYDVFFGEVLLGDDLLFQSCIGIASKTRILGS